MSGPERLDRILDDVLNEMGVARPADVVDLVARWAELAGDTWAARSRPVGLADGTLTVEVSDGTAASILRYQSSALVARLEGTLGKGVVDAVRVHVSRSATRPRTGN